MELPAAVIPSISPAMSENIALKMATPPTQSCRYTFLFLIIIHFNSIVIQSAIRLIWFFRELDEINGRRIE